MCCGTKGQKEGIQYSPEVTSHSLETFSLLLTRVPLELAIYQVESISF